MVIFDIQTSKQLFLSTFFSKLSTYMNLRSKYISTYNIVYNIKYLIIIYNLQLKNILIEFCLYYICFRTFSEVKPLKKLYENSLVKNFEIPSNYDKDTFSKISKHFDVSTYS